MDKPRLLFITPVLPSAKGGGSAMRAFQFVKAYSESYEISLVHIDFGYFHKSLYHYFNKATTDELSAYCADIRVLKLLHVQTLTSLLKVALFMLNASLYFKYFKQPSDFRFFNKTWGEKLKACLDHKDFAVVHVFKFYLLPLALALKENTDAPSVWLDMDDLEVLAKQRIAKIYAANNISYMAELLEQDAEQIALWQGRHLPEADRIYLCSKVDKQRLLERLPSADIKVVPNVLAASSVSLAKPSTDVFTFLFVGSFRYFPNVDAVDYFCTQIMPIINARLTRPIQVLIVGGGLNASVQGKIADTANISYLGYIDNLLPLYENTNVAIVPIRAGSGTRIKILEAFNYQRPVVTTTEGVEGIDAIHKQHVLIADTAEDFAAQCLSLIDNPDLAASLADNAAQLFHQKYSMESLTNILKE